MFQVLDLPLLRLSLPMHVALKVLPALNDQSKEHADMMLEENKPPLALTTTPYTDSGTSGAYRELHDCSSHDGRL